MRTKHVLAAAMSVTAAAVGIASGQTSGQTAGHTSAAPRATDAIHFKLQRSSGVVAADCLQNAFADVTVDPQGQVEVMTVQAHNLPPQREFDLFILQVPNAPFGESWYQGDLKSDASGNGSGRYVGRFSSETFVIAPGVAPAPLETKDGPFPDVTPNVASGPIRTYHVGLWFGSPAAAAAAGCPTTVTPFNGEHRAGIQALSTRQFLDRNGPLRQIPL